MTCTSSETSAILGRVLEEIEGSKAISKVGEGNQVIRLSSGAHEIMLTVAPCGKLRSETRRRSAANLKLPSIGSITHGTHLRRHIRTSPWFCDGRDKSQ
jgi:hypothetical protein